MSAPLKRGKSKNDEPHYEIPDAQTLQEAGDLMIKDEWGKEIPFKTLYDNKPGTQQLIIFIRHFFSSVSYVLYWLLGATFALTVDGQDCEAYIRTLSKELPPAFLNASTPPTKLFIIGCGEMGAIPDYRTRTMHSILGADTHFPIYCDPSRKLYQKLGMLENLNAGDKQPEYVKKGAVASVLTGAKHAVTSGASAIIQGGHPAQNGGEMLFANGDLVWFKRMRHTQDHAEVAELKEVLGLQ